MSVPHTSLRRTLVRPSSFLRRDVPHAFSFVAAVAFRCSPAQPPPCFFSGGGVASWLSAAPRLCHFGLGRAVCPLCVCFFSRPSFGPHFMLCRVCVVLLWPSPAPALACVSPPSFRPLPGMQGARVAPHLLFFLQWLSVRSPFVFPPVVLALLLRGGIFGCMVCVDLHCPTLPVLVWHEPCGYCPRALDLVVLPLCVYPSRWSCHSSLVACLVFHTAHVLLPLPLARFFTTCPSSSL